MDLFLCPAPAPSLSLHPCNLSDAKRPPDSAVILCSVQPYSASTICPRDVVQVRCSFTLYSTHSFLSWVSIPVVFRFYSLILARILQHPCQQCTPPLPHPPPQRLTYSLSRKRWNSSSPTLMGEPPYCSHCVSIHASQGRGDIRMPNIPGESAPCRRRTRPWAGACHPCRGRRGRRPGPWPR